MYRKLSAILLLIVFSACHGMQEKPSCGNSLCTQEFRSIAVHFVDKHGAAVSVTEFQAVDFRTNKRVYSTLAPTANLAAGYYLVADDGNKAEFTTGGDNVKVTATNPATGQVKTVIYKIAGDCCHISKVSGSLEVVFDL